MIHIDATSLLRALASLGGALETAGNRALAEGISAAETHAKATTSYNDRTGDLRASTKAVFVGNGSAELRAEMPYAEFIENGTVHITARKFMRDAAKVGGAEFRYEAELHMDEAITAFNGT